MTCKLRDEGPGKVAHYGAHAGAGVYFVKDGDSVTVCQHPHADPTIAPTFSATLPIADVQKALSEAHIVPEPTPEAEGAAKPKARSRKSKKAKK